MGTLGQRSEVVRGRFELKLDSDQRGGSGWLGCVLAFQRREASTLSHFLLPSRLRLSVCSDHYDDDDEDDEDEGDINRKITKAKRSFRGTFVSVKPAETRLISSLYIIPATFHKCACARVCVCESSVVSQLPILFLFLSFSDHPYLRKGKQLPLILSLAANSTPCGYVSTQSCMRTVLPSLPPSPLYHTRRK